MMQIIPAGDKVLVFASGKRIELTEAEYAELEAQFKKVEYYPVYPSIPQYPVYPTQPWVITTGTSLAREILSVF
jgi:hypothetical protein